MEKIIIRKKSKQKTCFSRLKKATQSVPSKTDENGTYTKAYYWKDSEPWTEKIHQISRKRKPVTMV